MIHPAFLRRLRAGRLPIVESTLAATLAWVIDTSLVGHRAPFFAPAAALIVLGQVHGQRLRRAVEVLLGVAGGVLVADVVARTLGSHQTWTIFTVIALTLTVSVAIGASTVFLVQAAVSALYVAVVTPPGHGIVPVRFIDALVGGAVALAASQLGSARRPLDPVVREVQRICAALAEVMDELAEALRTGEEATARAALLRARAVDPTLDALRTAVTAAGESLLLRLRLPGRARVGGVEPVSNATLQLDFVVRNVRVLARAAVALTRLRVPAPPALAAAVTELAGATRQAGATFEAAVRGDPALPRIATAAETGALQALATARPVLTGAPALPVVMVVGQLRSTTIDLMRAIGVDDVDALDRADDALGLLHPDRRSAGRRSGGDAHGRHAERHPGRHRQTPRCPRVAGAGTAVESNGPSASR